MRSDRSTISGLGAAVSLVAAAGFAFLITAAIVAFHGFPRIASLGSRATLVVASSQGRPQRIVLGAPNRAAVAAALARVGLAVPGAGVVAGPRQLTPSVSPSLGVPPSGSSRRAGSSASLNASSTAAAPPTAAGGPGSAAQIVPVVTSALGSGVSGVGDTVSSTGASAGSVLAPASPTVGKLVAGAGEVLGRAVKGFAPVVGGTGR